jgi:phosphoribosylformylglycinamidine synthase PurS subunit
MKSRFKARIEVRLKKQEYDPEADTVKRSLVDLGFPISEARVAKVYELILDSKSKKDAEKIARASCLRLLANPTKDEFFVEVSQISSD